MKSYRKVIATLLASTMISTLLPSMAVGAEDIDAEFVDTDAYIDEETIDESGDFRDEIYTESEGGGDTVFVEDEVFASSSDVSENDEIVSLDDDLTIADEEFIFDAEEAELAGYISDDSLESATESVIEQPAGPVPVVPGPDRLVQESTVEEPTGPVPMGLIQVVINVEAEADDYYILEADAYDPTGSTDPSTYTFEWQWKDTDGDSTDFLIPDSDEEYDTGNIIMTIEHTFLNESHSRVRVRASSDELKYGVRCLTAGSSSDVAWIENPLASYVVVFDANGGSFASGLTRSTQYYEQDENARIDYQDAPTCSNDGKMLLGWSRYTNATAADTINLPKLFTLDSSYKSYTANDNVVLYAVWAEGCEVAFDVGNGILKHTIVDDGEWYSAYTEELTRTLPVNVPIYLDSYFAEPNDAEGCDFVGWQREDGTIVTPQTQITLTGNETLHAVYSKRIPIRLKMGKGGKLYGYGEPNGVTSADITIGENKTIEDLETDYWVIVNPNYQFVGWTDVDGGTTPLDKTETFKADTTYYAVYKTCPHSWLTEVTKKVTCTTAGEKIYTCELCGRTNTVTVAATGHTYGSYVITKAATALAAGSKYRLCKTCKHKQIVTIPKLTPYVKFNVSSLRLQVGQTFRKVTVTKQKGDYIKSWKTSNAAIVKVSGAYGTATANKVVPCTLVGVKPGWATITVTLASGKTGSFKVGVQTTKVATTSLKLTAPKPTNTAGTAGTVTIVKNKYYPIKYARAPISANDKLEFYSYNKAVATVSSTGVIKGIANGTTKIRIKAGSKYAFVTVNVKSFIAFNATELPMQKKQVFKGFKVAMQKGDYVTSWKSSNTAVVKVSGGIGSTNGTTGTCTITAMSPAAATSTAYITVTLFSGLKKTVKVIVRNSKVVTTSIALTAPASAKLAVAFSKTYQIKYKRTPITAQDTVTFISSNDDTASVSSTGVIRGEWPGNCIVSVKSGTKIARVAVTVG